MEKGNICSTCEVNLGPKHLKNQLFHSSWPFENINS